MCMASKGQDITLSIGTLNVRGFRQKKKRKAVMQQAKLHCDVLLMQDSHLDSELCKNVSREWKGSWAHNTRANNSGGVALYHRANNTGRLLTEDAEDFEDSKGSLIGRTLQINDCKIYLISAYAPCCDKRKVNLKANLDFLRGLERLVMEKKARGLEVIVCGDLNFIRDTFLDADGGNPTIYKEQADWLTHFEDNCGMMDAFRFLRPEERMFSWSRTGCFRRLDYVLCSKQLLERTRETLIVPVPSSDHRLLGIKLILGKDPIGGPGLWRHNDAMLKDTEYKKVIEDCIEEVKKQPFKDKTAQWEFCKYKIRDTALHFGKARARAQRNEKLRLEEMYAKALNDDDDETSIDELKQQLHKIYEEEDDVIRFRTGLDVIEKGEKITPFFFRTIEQNRKESNVLTLKTENYPQGTSTKLETMKEIEGHFKRTFADDDKEKDTPDEWYEGIKKIPDEISKSLEENVKLNDITHALFKLMKEGKSPGNDGLTSSFYRVFWVNISGLVMGSLREGWEGKRFSDSQRQSVIRLIEKQGKSREMMNGWRPISLMNVDIKLLAKVLAERLKIVCKEIIGEEQLAYVEGNDIHEGHLILNKVLEMARNKKLSGLMACIDFKAAFDSVRHKFIYTTLEKMGLGQNFISMIRSLYTDNKSAVLNFGTTTGWISLERSCRQGDPVSAYLFILAMEVLLNKLRKLKLGIKMEKLDFWSTAFADDLTLLLKNNHELKTVLKILKDYKEITGLDINYNKSEILELNYSYDINIGIPLKKKVKITGIWFALDHELMMKQNWNDACAKVSGKLNSWKGRNLSEVGRSNVIKAQISPIILYTATVIPLPPDVEKRLSQLTYKFMGNGSEKEQRALLCMKREKGGLEIPNWKARCNSALALWTVKANQSEKSWAKLMNEEGIDWNSSEAMATIRSDHKVEGFLGRCVTEWYRIAALLPPSDNAIVWPYVKGPQISRMMRKKCPNLSFAQAELGLPSTLNYLEKRQIHLSLEEARRRQKRQHIEVAYEGKKYLQKDLTCTKWPKPTYNQKGEQIPLGEGRLKNHQKETQDKLQGTELSSVCSLKSLYWLNMSSIVPAVHPFRNKMEITYGDIDWKTIDQQKISTYSRVIAFQWRSTHGKLYANKHFHAMGIKKTRKCMYCEEESQSLEHLFLECRKIQRLFACFEKSLKLDEGITNLEKILGIDPSINRTKLTIKKLGLLRRLIYQSNHRDESPKWGQFLELVEQVYTFEYAIAERNGRIPQHLLHWEK